MLCRLTLIRNSYWLDAPHDIWPMEEMDKFCAKGIRGNDGDGYRQPVLAQ